MYPFGGLPENLIAFCAVLRGEHGFGLGPGEVRDAARALEFVDLTDQHVVRNALRPVLACSTDDVVAFDEAFTRFFFPGPAGAPQLELPSHRRTRDDAGETTQDVGQERQSAGEEAANEEAGGAAPFMAAALAASEEAGAGALARARYSPFEAEHPGDAPEIVRAEPAWRDAARELVRRLQFGLGRRWRPASRGRRFDLRRTWRAGLHTGGEALVVRWLHRPKRAPRVVLLVDGSRSMAAFAPTALQIAVAIASVMMRLDVFTFSTGLEPVTDLVRRAATGQGVRLDRVRFAWGGGTAIGACLREFVRHFGDRLLSRDTVVIIVSDGLDVGDVDVLRDSMRTIRRRCAGIVWLNPLLETAGYEPTARGMAAARPFITTFAGVTDARDLARLARTLRIAA